MPAGSFVTGRRDHRRDRGESVSNGMVNNMAAGDRTGRRDDVDGDVTPCVFRPVSKKKLGSQRSVLRPALSFHTYFRFPCAFSPLFELRIEIDLMILETADRRRFCHDVVSKFHTLLQLSSRRRRRLEILYAATVASWFHRIYIFTNTSASCIMYRSARD